MSPVYPWQENAWRQIGRQLESGRLAHGLLLIGPAGTGAEDFARALAGELLGGDSDRRSQVLLEAGSHPDLRILEPAEAGKAIRVDAVRDLIDFLNLTPQYGERKVAVILDAESMNRHAANSLLKTLEEPPAHSQLLLVSGQPALLPVTIRSRCQQVDLRPSGGTETVSWLQERLDDPEADAELLLAIAGNAPLAALELSAEQGLPLRDRIIEDLLALDNRQADTVSVADRWNKAGALAVHVWLYRLCCEFVRCRLRGAVALTHSDRQEHLQRLTGNRSVRQVIEYHDRVVRNQYLLTGPYSPNPAVLLEDFLLQWQNRNGD